MKAAVYVEPSRVETQDTRIPSLGKGDLLLRVRACGVCGTDIRKVRHALIRPPVVLGHEVAGEVVAVGEEVRKFEVGDRVVVAHHTPCYACHYCRHGNYSMCRLFKKSNLDPGGFAEYVRVPARHVEMTAFRIPSGLTYERAIFMEPLACVLRNLKRTTIQPGDTVWVVGLGSMGLLTGQLVRRQAAHVIATDPREDRRTIARYLKFDAVLDPSEKVLPATIEKMTQGRGVDLVVLTAGTAATYGEVISYVRDGGTINLFAGLPPGAQISYDANELYSREITLYASYSPSPAELAEALEHLRSGTVDVDVFSSQRFPLEELPAAIEAVASQKILKAIICPEEAHA